MPGSGLSGYCTSGGSGPAVAFPDRDLADTADQPTVAAHWDKLPLHGLLKFPLWAIGLRRIVEIGCINRRPSLRRGARASYDRGRNSFLHTLPCSQTSAPWGETTQAQHRPQDWYLGSRVCGRSYSFQMPPANPRYDPEQSRHDGRPMVSREASCQTRTVPDPSESTQNTLDAPRESVDSNFSTGRKYCPEDACHPPITSFLPPHFR